MGVGGTCDLAPFQYSSTHDMRKPPMHVHSLVPRLAGECLHASWSDAASMISRVRFVAKTACASSSMKLPESSPTYGK